MNIVKEVIIELVSMFIGDARLSVAVLVVVAISALFVKLPGIDALLGGVTLLVGCLVVVVESVRRAASRQDDEGDEGTGPSP